MTVLTVRRAAAMLFMTTLLVTRATTTVGAQEPRRLTQPDSIPLELATALISSGGLGGDPQILVGAMPGWMTNRIYVPPMGRVLGSAFIGTTALAIVGTPDMPDVAVSTLKRELLTRGWHIAPGQPIYGGGFRPAALNSSADQSTRVILCGDDQQMLTVTASRRRGVSTDVVMRVGSYTGFTTCNPPQMPPGMQRSPWPTLFNPQGVSERDPQCGGDGFNSNATGTTLRTPMTPAALLDHYARQLQDSGWKIPTDAASITGRTWTRTDSAGAPVELTITVASSVRDPSCRSLNMNVRTLKKP